MPAGRKRQRCVAVYQLQWQGPQLGRVGVARAGDRERGLARPEGPPAPEHGPPLESLRRSRLPWTSVNPFGFGRARSSRCGARTLPGSPAHARQGRRCPTISRRFGQGANLSRRGFPAGRLVRSDCWRQRGRSGRGSPAACFPWGQIRLDQPRRGLFRMQPEPSEWFRMDVNAGVAPDRAVRSAHASEVDPYFLVAHRERVVDTTLTQSMPYNLSSSRATCGVGVAGDQYPGNAIALHCTSVGRWAQQRQKP